MRARFVPLDDLCILVDDASLQSDHRPPPIGRKVPDVHIRSVGSARLLALGEAKTAQDVDTDHTRIQLREYLAYLKHHPSPFLVIAVPWHQRKLMASIIAKTQAECVATNVTVILLEDCPG
jgi:hypothetical protein